ncbi:M56 family metallopeptidase [Candidatus Latescibacterota bacterium]
MWKTPFTEWLLYWSNILIPYAVSLLVHSTIIIILCLWCKHILRKRGAAIQSLILRASLVAILLSPFSMILFNDSGMRGFHIPQVSFNNRDNTPLFAHREYIAPLPKHYFNMNFKSHSPEAIRDYESEFLQPMPEIKKVVPVVQTNKTSGVSPLRTSDRNNSAAIPHSINDKSEVNPKRAGRTTSSSNNYLAGFYIIVTLAWLGFSVFFLLKTLAHNLYIQYICRSSFEVKPFYMSICSSIARELGIVPPIILQNPYVKSTFLTGLFHPVIIIPFGENELYMVSKEVFLHELAHLVRRDYLWNLLCQVGKIVIPIHPLVWILTRQIEETSDFVCDDYVVEYGNNPRSYAVQLYTMAQSFQPYISEGIASVGIISMKSSLRKRLERILDNSHARFIKTSVREVLSISLFFVCAFILTGFVRFKGESIRGNYNNINNNLNEHVKTESVRTVKTQFLRDKLLTRDKPSEILKNKIDSFESKKLSDNVQNEKVEDTSEHTFLSNEQVSWFADTISLVQNNRKTEIPEIVQQENEKTLPTVIQTVSETVNKKEQVEIIPLTVSEKPGFEEHFAELPADGIPIAEIESPVGMESKKPETFHDDVGTLNELYSDVPDTSLFLANYWGTEFVATGFDVKVPAVAKIVNVTVDFDYENHDFDLRNAEDRRIYDLYLGLDKYKNEPVWSPDGKWIAFTDRNRIWIVSPGGGEPELVYESFIEGYSIGNFESLCFTPDSREITFKKDVYDENRGSVIYIQENNSIRNPVFSNPIPCIESVNIYTGEHRTIADGGTRCAWSPSGRYLCYLNWDIHKENLTNHNIPAVYDTVTGTTRFLADDDGKRYGQPAFSPDESHIIIPVRENYGPIDFYRIPLDGGKPEQLTFYNENDGYGKYRNFPDYSPDGQWILYTDFTWSTGYPDMRLFLYHTVTGSIYEFFENHLYRSSYGKWSPDGRKICYLVPKNTGNCIYICDFIPPVDPKPVAVESSEPEKFSLSENYPNPFNTSTTIEFFLPEAGAANLAIFNITGQKIRELVSEHKDAGGHRVVWDSCDDDGMKASTGTYLSRLSYDGNVLTDKMLLVK